MIGLEIAEGLNTLEVFVTLVAVTRSVRIMEFNRWFKQKRGSPSETANRNNIRRILGLHDKGKL